MLWVIYMRCFKKIKYEQFKKDICDDEKLYNEYDLPRRATKFSAGYDFYSLSDFVILPGEIRKVPTGLKVKMNEDEAFLFYVRSSMGFKYNVRLTNQVGIIDADYYENPNNDGHMWISLQNHGDEIYVVKKGDAFCQGMFIKYLKTDDDKSFGERLSGLGSTNKEV